ncbi:MAG: hypothetical protein QM680_02000 [Luteolibacter sp.]
MKPILAFFMSACLHAHADEEKKPAANTSKDGVYYTCTGVMSTVLELKNGKFRYWFESDSKDPDEPNYPLSGNFTVTGDTITLQHPAIFPPQNRWHFRTFENIPSLWREDALNFTFPTAADMTRFKQAGAGSVLILTSKTAEKAWKERSVPSLNK